MSERVEDDIKIAVQALLERVEGIRQDLAEYVEEGRNVGESVWRNDVSVVLAAYDALKAQLADAEQALSVYRNEWPTLNLAYMEQGALRAQLADAERARLELLRDFDETLADFAQALGLSERIESDGIRCEPGHPQIMAAITAATQREGALKEALVQTTTFSGHGHWDNEGTRGANCSLCIARREWLEKYEPLFRPALLTPPPGREKENSDA